MLRIFLMVLLAAVSSAVCSASPVEAGDARALHRTRAEEATLPHPFVDVMHARHEGSFYDRQAEDWKTIVTGDCSSDEAWFHYYKTANYSNRFGSGTHDLAAILTAGKKVMDPNNFYLPYLRFAANQHPTERWTDLLIAYANGPNKHECYPGLATYYESRGMAKERNDILEKLHAAHPIPAGVMEYNYNQLMSVGNNGILLTNGDADTYPSWILQSAYAVRPDVRVASIPLLRGYPEMRRGFFAEFGMSDPFPATGPPPSVPELLEALAGQTMPVYLAATGRHHLAELPKEKLYLSGLAFYYGNFPIDNLEILASNFESKFRMDLLRKPLSNGPAQAVADQLNQNYLPALLELHAYNQANASPRFGYVLPLLRSVAARAGRGEEVAAYLRGETNGTLASGNPGVTARELDRRFVPLAFGKSLIARRNRRTYRPHPVYGQLRFQDTEVSNAEYQLFLEDLLRQRRFGLLDSVAIDSIRPEEVEPAGLREGARAHFSGAKAVKLGSYPIVNVPHRAALLYARWLTDAYNNDPRKESERRVRFRLPTVEEFIFAARAGREGAPYPWGGPYYRNAKGCLLANFNTRLPESQEEFQDFAYRIKTNSSLKAKLREELLEKVNCDFEDDGGLFTVPVDSYFPNDYGLYNMAGNAAEMTATPGKTMGGSWLDGSYHMQVGVVKERQLPHPSTGFRLVMEYVD